MLQNAKLLSEMRDKVRKIFSENTTIDLVYHNYAQTEENVEVARELSESEDIPDDQKENILFACWFLYTGYLDNYEDPLPKSAENVREFLSERNYDSKKIKEVERLILNSSTDIEPENIEEMIVQDAVSSFLGRKRFFRLAELWRLEKEEILEKELLPDHWSNEMMKMLTHSHFYTPAARKRFTNRKNKNILKQRKNLEKATKTSMRIKTGKDFGRGIDTLYRNTLRGHLDLSSIADGKANMIISINTIVLSILITAGSASISISKLNIQENVQFIVPTLILMTSSLGAIIFGVLSAIPKYSETDFDMKDIRDNKVSLLFFNNFLSVEKEEFVEYLNGLKKNQSLLYDDLARDVYNLGSVLKKKYQLLNISYKLFVGGLALSFICFFALFALYGI